MAIRNAIDYGGHFERSPYGERYDFVSDGSGDLEDEVVKPRGDVDRRLYDIMVMRSEIARSPMTGDKFLLDCLDVDEVLVRQGSPEELLTDTYPKLPDRIQGLIKEIIAVEENIATVEGVQIPEGLTTAQFQQKIDTALIGQYELDLAA